MFCKYIQALQAPGILTGCSEWQDCFKRSLYVSRALNLLDSTLFEGNRAHFVVSEFIAHNNIQVFP